MKMWLQVKMFVIDIHFFLLSGGFEPLIAATAVDFL